MPLGALPLWWCGSRRPSGLAQLAVAAVGIACSLALVLVWRPSFNQPKFPAFFEQVTAH
jgi:hypothetical protein